MGKIQEIFNFNDIGTKIKNLAKWSCWISILLIWIATPIAFIALVADSGTAGLCWIPLVGAIVGPVLVWIGSWIMYAFGEFVEDTHAMRNKEAPSEQKTPVATVPKQEVSRHTSTNTTKLTKVFSVLAGTFFTLSGLLLLWYNVGVIVRGGYGIIYVFPTLLSIVLLIVFMFKRSQKGIAIGWASLAGASIFSIFTGWYFTARITLLITIVVYLLFMLLTIFQKKLMRYKIVQFAAFLLPLAHGFFSVVSNYYGYGGLLDIGTEFLGMVFYLLYLINANNVQKTPVPEESQTDV